MQLDVEKALDEQLLFEAFRTERSGHADSISGWPIRGAGTVALGIVILAPVVRMYGPLVVALTIWGIAQSALFTICHARVMKAAWATPAIGASLNISGCNIGIGLGAIIGGRVIDHFGLSDVGLAAGMVIALAITMGALLAFTTRTSAKCPVP